LLGRRQRLAVAPGQGRPYPAHLERPRTFRARPIRACSSSNCYTSFRSSTISAQWCLPPCPATSSTSCRDRIRAGPSWSQVSPGPGKTSTHDGKTGYARSYGNERCDGRTTANGD
jgi:hypothetical protein